MLVEVSIGEVIDKLSILDIKKSKITNQGQLVAIENERAALSSAREYIKDFPNLSWYSLLLFVNTRIWDLTDEIKSFSWSYDTEKFARISNTIFDLNQQRFRLKERFNNICVSNIQEQKSYNKTTAYIYIPSLDSFYKNLSAINKKSLEHDRIVLVTPFMNEVRLIYPHFPFTVSETCESSCLIGVEDIGISNEESDIYDFPPIKYYGTGRLGDFILSLSICAENFYNTGRKAVIYIGENQDNSLKYSLEHTLNDTTPVITQQVYVKSYKIHNNEQYDINLFDYVKSPYINKGSWHVIYKSVFNVEWGSRQWIKVPVDPKFKGIVFIHSSITRLNTTFNFKEAIASQLNNFIFISNDEAEYNDFVKRTNCSEIPFYKVNTFTELSTAIYSCGLFLGNLSMPNALADSMHKDRYCMLSGLIDDRHNINMEHIWPMQKHIFQNFSWNYLSASDDLSPINYLAGGKLGDFILSLSVVAENFRKTGRKGNIFLTNRGDCFKYPLEMVLSDTQDIVNYQEYINSYKIHTDEACDINLTLWRNSPLIHESSWHNIYKSTFGVEWGTKPWIKVPHNPLFDNTVCIHSSEIRENTKFDINAVLKEYPDYKFIFISAIDAEYEKFVLRSKTTEIPFVKLISFNDMCSAIYNCKFFIGNLSMPLAIADSMFKKRICLLSGSIDDKHLIGMKDMWSELSIIPN
jgi:hypothetical protein